MKKYYILDTNILIHCPDAILKFQENDVFIPYMVLEELDKKKDEPGEVGYSAREAIRNIDRIRDKKNCILPGGGKLLFVGTEEYVAKELPIEWSPSRPDNIILATALAIKRTFKTPETQVILVTNDISMRIKSKCINLEVQEYKNDRVSVEIYEGRTELNISIEEMENFRINGKINTKDGIKNNEFVILNCPEMEDKSVLGKCIGDSICSLEYNNYHPMGIYARNAGQIFFKEALLSPCDTHPLVLCNGPAGTGKTLLALACGLEQVMETKEYESILLCRPNVMMGGEEIGFLPGTEKEKISPLFRGCYDNLRVIFGNNGSYEEEQDKIDEIFDRRYINIEALSYIRGRSINNSFIIIDEAQNTSPTQIMSIITRAGEGSKFCIIGDINQIDNPRLDRENNGLAFAIDRMKDSPICHIMTFSEEECTRSILAKEASELLAR